MFVSQIKQMFPLAKSGLYAIQDPCLSGDKLFTTARLTVYCDMETDGGGWIVIQRRNASMGWINFVRGWADYEKGFGVIDDEFWIGLKIIHELTNQQSMALNIRVWNSTGNSINWNYQLFGIYDKTNKYAVSALSGSSGSGSGGSSYGAFLRGASPSFHFNTYDNYVGSNNCGFSRQSGWWYSGGSCGENANLNGRHHPSGIYGTDSTGERLFWWTSSGYRFFTHSEMKIRPQTCPLR